VASGALNSQGGVVGSQISVGGIDGNLPISNIYVYTGGIEHKLWHDVVGGATYSGSKGTGLYIGGGAQNVIAYGVDINRFAGDLIQNYPTPKRLNQSFGSITYAQGGAESRYNAFIASVSGRFAKRGYFDVSYTRSSSSDDAQYYPTGTDLNQYYGPSVFEVPNRVSASFSVDIPGVKGGNPLTRTATDGWVISNVTIFQSGAPFSVYTDAPFEPILNESAQVIGLQPGSGDYNADGYNYDYPNVVSYSQGTSRQAFLKGAFPLTNFTQPTLGTEGNEKVNRFRGPNYFDGDFSLAKNTQLYEQLNLQIRFDFFNIFNRPNLTGMNSDLASGSFGTATSQFNPRWLQLGAVLKF